MPIVTAIAPEPRKKLSFRERMHLYALTRFIRALMNNWPRRAALGSSGLSAWIARRADTARSRIARRKLLFNLVRDAHFCVSWVEYPVSGLSTFSAGYFHAL